jgi:hypothetical protein
MSGRPRIIRGLRIVMWDEMAACYHPYLMKGSELGVIGCIVTRDHNGRTVTEIEARQLMLLRKINWAYGEKCRAALPASSAVGRFVCGRVASQIRFGRAITADGEARSALRLRLLEVDVPDGAQEINVLANDDLAQLAFPYLRSGSLIAVHGSSAGEAGPLLVRHLVLLEDIDWEAGAAVQRVLQGS